MSLYANVIAESMPDDELFGSWVESDSVAIADTAPHTLGSVGFLPVNQVGVHLATTGTLVGHWVIEISGDESAENAAAPVHGGSWTDITAAFKAPAIAAVASSPNNQFTQALTLVSATIRATFTATSGAGTAKWWAVLKTASN